MHFTYFLVWILLFSSFFLMICLKISLQIPCVSFLWLVTRFASIWLYNLHLTPDICHVFSHELVLYSLNMVLLFRILLVSMVSFGNIVLSCLELFLYLLRICFLRTILSCQSRPVFDFPCKVICPFIIYFWLTLAIFYSLFYCRCSRSKHFIMVLSVTFLCSRRFF